MEGQLGRLRNYPRHHQDRGHRRPGARHQGLPVRYDLSNLEARTGHTDQHKTDQHCQTAACRDQQRLEGALAGTLVLVPKPDEQERRDAGHLPKNEQNDQVGGGNHAQHRTHEKQQVGKKTCPGLFFAEISTSVGRNQKTHAAY